MEVKLCKTFGWEDALDAARTTANKQILEKQPSEKFKRKLLAAEHSPIRFSWYIIRVDNVPKFVTEHIARHNKGIEKCIGTQRSDRTPEGTPRSELPQDAPTAILIEANAQSLINISKERLCSMASTETRDYWKLVLGEIAKKDPIVVDYCVPKCVYRGVCPEEKSCGFWKTKAFAEWRSKYVKMIEDVIINK